MKSVFLAGISVIWIVGAADAAVMTTTLYGTITANSFEKKIQYPLAETSTSEAYSDEQLNGTPISVSVTYKTGPEYLRSGGLISKDGDIIDYQSIIGGSLPFNIVTEKSEIFRSRFSILNQHMIFIENITPSDPKSNLYPFMFQLMILDDIYSSFYDGSFAEIYALQTVILGGMSGFISDLLTPASYDLSEYQDVLKGSGRFTMAHQEYVYNEDGFVISIEDGQIGYSFTIDSLTISAVPPSPVPVPAAAPLLIAGLGAIGFAARRRKSA